MSVHRFAIACVFVLAVTLPLRAQHAEPKGAAAAAHAADDHAAGGHAHFGEAGVNKDPSNVRTDLAIYSFLVFLLLFGSLSAFAWKPIVQGLEKREHKLQADVDSARINREASERLLVQHQVKLDQVQDEVREIFTNARKESDKLKDEIVAAANREAEAARKRAVADIEQARDLALNQLFDHMSQAVTSATRQIVGRSVTSEDQERLIRESLSDLSRNLN